MIGKYSLEPLTQGVYKRGDQLVELVTSKLCPNVKGLFLNGASILAITTTGKLVLQPLLWSYNYVTYENGITTHILRTSYVSQYVMCSCPKDMLP